MQIPQRTHALMELMFSCIKMEAAGMSVMPALDDARMERKLRRGRVRFTHWGAIEELVETAFAEYRERHGQTTVFGDREFEMLTSGQERPRPVWVVNGGSGGH